MNLGTFSDIQLNGKSLIAGIHYLTFAHSFAPVYSLEVSMRCQYWAVTGQISAISMMSDHFVYVRQNTQPLIGHHLLSLLSKKQLRKSPNKRTFEIGRNKPILLFNKPWTKGFLLDTECTMWDELDLHKCQSLPASTFAPSALLLDCIQSCTTQTPNTRSKTLPFQRLPWCDNPGHSLLVLEAFQPISLTVASRNNTVP